MRARRIHPLDRRSSQESHAQVRDIGGGFGQRTVVYPEYAALMIAARALNRPVKWVSARGEGFLTLTASFRDYFMPRAGLVPEIRSEENPTQSTVSPLGVKGVGESGCTASIPVLVGAVLDAVRPLGIDHLDVPLTPAKLWHAIHEAKKARVRRRGSARTT